MRSLILDTETTGLLENSLRAEKHQPRVIEFYGNVVEDDGEVVSELELLFDPGTSLTEEITNITGIKDDDLKGKLPFNAHESQIRAFVGSAEAMVAHNLSFDQAIISREFMRCGTLDRVQWPRKRICTVEATEWLKGYRLSLGALYEHLFAEPFPGAHRAKADVKALIRCWVELRKRGEV